MTVTCNTISFKLILQMHYMHMHCR